MLDMNTLMLMGLTDNAVIIQMEQERMAALKKRIKILDMVERLMGIDENLDDLLMAVEEINAREIG